MTLYERVGGAPAVHALADAWHRRVLADPVVEHAFSHGFSDDHVARLAAYWAQAWGGPDTFTATMGDEATVVEIHSHQGIHPDMDERAERCFVEATQDIDLDDDVRSELLDYWRWATGNMNAYPHDADQVPATIPFAEWPHRD
jgi:hemoglobin